MVLLRPTKINLTRPISIVLSVKSNFTFKDPIHNVEMVKSVTTISLSQSGVQNMNFPNSPSDEDKKTFAGLQALIKSCVDNAEDVKNSIHNIIIRTQNSKDEEERKTIMKMDFMAIKQWFMDDIRKRKIYKKFSEYDSTKKLKDFSRNFNNFIIDRNKYTHAQLCFISPNYDYAIDYIETPEQQNVYANINIEILKSYNEFYTKIQKVISEYQIAIQNL